ncbi:MAG: hypothetical protein VB957_09635 [Pseudomonadales bacterium]
MAYLDGDIMQVAWVAGTVKSLFFLGYVKFSANATNFRKSQPRQIETLAELNQQVG